MESVRNLSARPSWNPFDCRGTALPPHHLLAAKLLALYLAATGQIGLLPERFLPFWAPLDRIGHPEALRLLCQIVMAAAIAGLFVNRAVRLNSFLIGSVLLFSTLASRVYFQNNIVLFGCLLFLIGLQDADRNVWMPRLQVVLVYLGAGLNKLFDADWRNGQYFEFWTHDILRQEAYARAAAALPPLFLSRAVSWATIAVELGLAAAFAVPRTRPAAITAGIAFHAAMLVFTGGLVSVPFFCGMLAAYLFFLKRAPGPAWAYAAGTLALLSSFGRIRF